MKFNVNIFSQLHLQVQNFIFISCLSGGLGMRKIVYTCKRIHKPGTAFSGFSQIFMEFCRSNVELAPPHENILNDITNPKIVYNFFLVCFLEYYPASLMDKLLSAMYLISSEWDMQHCVQFPTVVGFVDIQWCVWEKTMRK